jgi:CBS domain-containing protein
MHVLRYTAGKADWLANGLPSEGKLAHTPHVGNLARRDVPTCHLKESVSEVQHRLSVTGWDVAVVVNDENIVFGLVRREALPIDPQISIEQVMERNPRTFRLNVTPEKAAEYMRRQSVNSVLVTTSDGKLVGLLRREDSEGQPS